MEYKMLGFRNFLIESKAKKASKSDESDDEGSGKNTILGTAYETGTALHVHKNSGSSANQDPEHLSRIQKLTDTYNEAMKQLSPDKQKQVQKGAADSGKAYLASMKKEGIKPEDISEVHHTHKGIGPLLGKKVSQAKNPPDIAVRLRRPHTHGQGPNKDLHFASLKLTPGTASNNGTGAIDELGKDEGHVKTNINKIWKAGREVSGVGSMSHGDLGDLRRSVDPKRNAKVDPKRKALYDRIDQSYKTTRQAVLSHHKEAFDGSTLAQQKAHIAHLMKSNPDASYHYVVGEKGGKSVPIDEHPNVKAAREAKSFHTEVRGTRMHIYDHEGKHLLSVEHRSTHGPWSSTQANAKFESLKVNPSIAGKPSPAKSPDKSPSPAKTPTTPTLRVRSSQPSTGPIASMPNPGIKRKPAPAPVGESMPQDHSIGGSSFRE
jgi:hypothetical protein